MNESLNRPEAADLPAKAATAAPDATQGTGQGQGQVVEAIAHEPEETSSAAPLSPGAQFLLVFPPIMLPMFMAVADQTIVATALPAIASSLGEIERASWVVVSYLIANTIAAPVYGRS